MPFIFILKYSKKLDEIWVIPRAKLYENCFFFLRFLLIKKN